MPGFTESSITLNFPDNNFFRFAEQKGYKALSGNHFKEMDACWYEANNNIYWLIELKDFTLASLSTAETVEKKSWDIAKKAIDSLCMFLSAKHTYPYTLNPCFPTQIPNEVTQFKFVTIIHCLSAQKSDVQLINEKFKNKFKPYADLFGIGHYSVVEHSIATRIIPNNIVM